MAGDPSNAAVWANADVYIGGLDANIPSGGDPFDDSWDLVGLLSGDDGFTEKMAINSKDFYAWGGILVATTRNQFKLTRMFTALEDNQTVFDLWYPGHTVVFDDSNGYEGDVYVPDLQAKFRIGFETRTGSTVKRVISTNYAQVDDRGDNKEGEQDMASRPATVAIYPDNTGRLFHTYRGATVAVTSIASAPTTVAKAVAASQQLTITATMADMTTAVVTGEATYSSSDPSKATVSNDGLVTGVASGTATITVTYGGKTTTVAATIS